MADGAKPTTPDFYEYDWLPPSSVERGERFVTMRWSDGAELEAFDLWLFENAVETGGIDAATREGLLDPAFHDLGRRVSAARIAPCGSVEVTFTPNDVVGRFHPGWLHHVAVGAHLAASWLPEPIVWTSADITEPPTHDGLSVLHDDDALRGWLNDMVSWGLARLRGLPDDPDIGLAVGARIGALRDTNFGIIWDVKADVQLAGNSVTNSTANTNLRLGPHTDLPTRETPAGFQFLHCYANTTTGGNSTMADGAAIVEALRNERPDHYEALTTLNWVFFNRGPGIDHRWSGPMIDLGVNESPLTLRAFYPVRGFPDMTPADMPRAYEAMSAFSTLAADPRFQISYPFLPGDMVGFDNRRMLHGRDAYESSGRRHLRGIYIDHDEVYSATRVANRRAALRATTDNVTKEFSNG